MQEQLGTQLTEGLTSYQVLNTHMKSESDINDHFIPNYPAEPDQTNALWNDEYYGLSSPLHYNHWNNLLHSDDTLGKKKNLFWFWELQTYFGLSFDQIGEM